MSAVLGIEPRSGKPRKRKYRPLKLDTEKVKELHSKGLNTVEIAKHQGVKPSTVWRFLQNYKDNIQHVDYFKNHRADVLASIQAKALEVQERILDSFLDGVPEALPDKVKADVLASTNRIAGTLFDKERLERGESTQNVSTVSRMVDASVSSLHKRKPLISNEAPIEDSSRT